MSETPSIPPGGESAGHVQQILAALGGQPVLLPIPAGQKGPRYGGWQSLTWEQSQDPEFRLRVPEAPMPGERFANDDVEIWRERRYADLLPAGNIGVLLGEPSRLEADGRSFRLCSIDVDETESVPAFLALNPALADTLQTVGARGRNFWIWVEGEFPRLHKNVCWIATEDHESKRSPGKTIKKGEPDTDRPWGEWRSTGGQTVIYGLHPSGCRYTRTGAAPARIKFSEIVWPAGLHLPWVKTPPAPAAPPAPPAGEAEEKLAKMIETYGVPWVVGKKGNITINQVFFAAFYAGKHRVIYSAEEQRFYRYQGEKSGLWSEQTADAIRWEFAADIKVVAEDNAAANPKEGTALIPKLILTCTTPLLGALVSMLRGSIERWRAFDRPVSPKTNRPRALVHLKNTMLDLDEFPPVSMPFSPDYMSRNQLNVAFKEDAECPRFLGELLGKAVSPSDIELMQKFAGQMLLGVNLTQKLLILEGTAGGGKSTFVNIMAEIIGRVNVAQLRTRHLGERFEIFGFLDKTLLIGVDVPGNFMMVDGAEVIKGLCGADLLDAEAKTGNRRFQVKGEFNILITCNTRLKVKLDGDGDAWRRRMAIITYESPKPAKPDPSFVHKLIAEEASGILNWMIEGAILLLKDINEHGGLVLSDRQKDRVESLLAESDSVKDFVRRGCEKAPRECKVSTEQLQQAYVDYCEARGWSAVSGKTLSYQLPDALLEIHGATAANDIKIHDSDKAKRGYRGVRIKAADNAGEDPVTDITSEPPLGDE
jgi:putative DNA primase/helicase